MANPPKKPVKFSAGSGLSAQALSGCFHSGTTDRSGAKECSRGVVVDDCFRCIAVVRRTVRRLEWSVSFYC